MASLSVLDLATVASGSDPARALAESTELAVRAERLGFRRFWVAEHHGMPAVASSAPPVLIAHLAARTDSIRVGSGGVMLPNHSPLVVAEQFATLEALHPGRIDLGLGRAPGTDPVTARALRRDAALSAENFPEDVVELYQYLAGSGQTAHPAAVPGRGYLPQMWLLGSSLFSAQLAGHLGLPFAFAYHFSPGPLDGAVAAYRSAFRPSPVLDTPRLMIGVAAICAPTEEEARWLSGSSALSVLQLHTGRLGPLPSPEDAAAYRFSPPEQDLVDRVMSTHVVGDPDQVAAGLEALVARTRADELILSTRLHSFADRARSLALVAAAWDHTDGRPQPDQVEGRPQPDHTEGRPQPDHTEGRPQPDQTEGRPGPAAQTTSSTSP
jgi:luciferase family oxidoreductase group 1